MTRQRKLYKLTPEDWDIFGKAQSNGSYFSSYYLREPDQTQGWIFDDNIDPPWQLAVHHASQTTLTIIGGMGSGKTGAVAVSSLIWAATLPNFKFLCVAPTAQQAQQMYSFLITTVQGTLFEERFMAREPTAGNQPRIYIDYLLPNGRKVSSLMEFLSASDDAVRIKNYEGDMVVLDQAEMMENLNDTISKLGTRLRGKVKGRYRLGRLVLIANAEDNPELWYIFDLAEEIPTEFLSVAASTYSNHNLTERQVRNFEQRLGNDAAAIEQHLIGNRPMGAGIEFSANLVKGMLDDTLDSVMTNAINLELPGYVMKRDEFKKADITEWSMPPEEDRVYYVIGDPGTGHPPGRNSPVIRVWDVTGYPDAPAVLRAFWWGNGGGKYAPWLDQFKFYIEQYHALLGAYDATAGQKVISETSFLQLDNVVPIDMGGIKKKSFITLLKLMMQSNRLKTPAHIKGQNYQYSKYRLPDEKLSQDIVACDLVFVGLLKSEGFDEMAVQKAKVPEDAEERKLPGDRYDYLRGERYDRVSNREDSAIPEFIDHNDI